MDAKLPPHEQLAAWRKARSLSLVDAAAKIGVHGPTWHEWESNGRVPLGGYRDALEILTGIPAVDWMPERERRAIDAARERVKQLLARPLLCAHCGHALSVRWAEGGGASEAAPPDDPPSRMRKQRRA